MAVDRPSSIVTIASAQPSNSTSIEPVEIISVTHSQEEPKTIKRNWFIRCMHSLWKAIRFCFCCFGCKDKKSQHDPLQQREILPFFEPNIPPEDTLGSENALVQVEPSPPSILQILSFQPSDFRHSAEEKAKIHAKLNRFLKQQEKNTLGDVLPRKLSFSLEKATKKEVDPQRRHSLSTDYKYSPRKPISHRHSIASLPQRPNTRLKLKTAKTYENLSSLPYKTPDFIKNLSEKEKRKLALFKKANAEYERFRNWTDENECGVKEIFIYEIDALSLNKKMHFYFRKNRIIGYSELSSSAFEHKGSLGSHKEVISKNEHYIRLKITSKAMTRWKANKEKEALKKQQLMVNYAYDKLHNLNSIIPSFFIEPNEILMKTVTGIDARNYVAKNKPLKLRGFIQVLKEIEQCYNNNVLLVDFNSGNFMVEERDKKQQIVLIDTDTLLDLDNKAFYQGSDTIPIARLYTPDCIGNQIEAVTEQNKEKMKKLINKSNQYSLLITMYELTTGLTRPTRATEDELGSQVQANNITPSEQSALLHWVERSFKTEYIDKLKSFLLDPIHNELENLSQMIP